MYGSEVSLVKAGHLGDAIVSVCVVFVCADLASPYPTHVDR